MNILEKKNGFWLIKYIQSQKNHTTNYLIFAFIIFHEKNKTMILRQNKLYVSVSKKNTRFLAIVIFYPTLNLSHIFNNIIGCFIHTFEHVVHVVLTKTQIVSQRLSKL